MLDEWLESQPVLVRISAAKGMRDRAESQARRQALPQVSTSVLKELFGRTQQEVTA